MSSHTSYAGSDQGNGPTLTVRAADPIQAVASVSRWQVVAAAGAIGEAVAHTPVIEAHLTEAPYMGVGFVLLAMAGFVIGTLILMAATELVWKAAALVASLALLGYVLSRAAGLPQIHDDIGNWQDPLGVVAVVCEAALLLTAVGHLVEPRLRASARSPQR